MSPLVVAGAGFVPNERVRVSTDGTGVKEVVADGRGRFVVRFSEGETCSGGTVVARGSGGSRASFNLAHVANVHCL